jgi:thioredoxin reductase (NADPH)
MNQEVYDVIIIGGGPAGLTAGIYTSRGGLKSLLIECFNPPSQVAVADLIENYPGFPAGIGGFELIERFKNQAKNFGLDFRTGKVDNIKLEDQDKNIWQVKTEDKVYHSLTVVLAVGARPRQLGIKGEAELRGKGVSYCAVCDGAFFKDKDIVVVGGGNTAVSEALYLTHFGRKVILVHRRNRLRAVEILAQRAKQDKKIKIVWSSMVTKIYGKNKVEGICLKNLADETESRVACGGVFISIGFVPNTDFLNDLVKLDENGYVITDQEMKTSCSGIFACGDCRTKSLRQVVNACGDGAVAASSAIKYVDRIKGRAYD